MSMYSTMWHCNYTVSSCIVFDTVHCVYVMCTVYCIYRFTVLWNLSRVVLKVSIFPNTLERVSQISGPYTKTWNSCSSEAKISEISARHKFACDLNWCRYSIQLQSRIAFSQCCSLPSVWFRNVDRFASVRVSKTKFNFSQAKTWCCSNLKQCAVPPVLVRRPDARFPLLHPALTPFALVAIFQTFWKLVKLRRETKKERGVPEKATLLRIKT